jgi:uracil-DNA glycosylase family 4
LDAPRAIDFQRRHSNVLRMTLPYPSEDLLACRHCPRLRHYLAKLRIDYPDYWNLPVPAYGELSAPLFIVGLAPGLHGANKTGIPFVGDASGDMLNRVLTQLSAVSLVRISNAVKCLPLNNSPSSREINNCQKFLMPEINVHFQQTGNRAILALGGVAHRAILKALSLKPRDYPFSHGNIHHLRQGQWLIDSYHCSRYNTQTGRLTEPMFINAVQSAIDCTRGKVECLGIE